MGIKADNKVHFLRVDSDALEELSNGSFDFFFNCLEIKYRAMKYKGLLGTENLLDVKYRWIEEILKESQDDRYRTTYFIMYKMNDSNVKVSMAIVQHRFNRLGFLSSMKLKEFYTFAWDYDEAYSKMRKFLEDSYRCERTILHKEAYKRVDHMKMGSSEKIY